MTGKNSHPEPPTVAEVLCRWCTLKAIPRLCSTPVLHADPQVALLTLPCKSTELCGRVFSLGQHQRIIGLAFYKVSSMMTLNGLLKGRLMSPTDTSQQGGLLTGTYGQHFFLLATPHHAGVFVRPYIFNNKNNESKIRLSSDFRSHKA